MLEARPIDGGEVTLHARQRLEAELWCEKKIPSDDQRFQIIRDLIGGLDARMLRLVDEDERSPEHEFVTRLLRTIGPQGPEPLRLHGRFYQKVAEIVHDLQDRTRVIHPRLLLIQSNATRESVQYQQYFADAPDKPDASSDRIEGLVHGWLNDLRRAEQALIEAREAVESQRSHGQASLPRGARQLLSVLETERACILGVQQGCLKRVVRHYESRRHWLEEQKTDRMLTDAKREELAALPGRIEGKYPEMDGYLNKARLAWRSSLAIDENNHRALDSACWILRDRFESGGMSDERRGELCAEWNEVLDTYSELDLSDEELDQYETRDWQYRREIGDVEGLRTVFEAMAKRNLPGAINLEARYKQQTEGPAAARAFLEERLRPQDILSNRSTLLLYYRLWWNAEAHLPSFFDKSSLCLPFSEAQWRRLAELAESYLTLDGERDNNMALFHLGWARLQLGESHRSGEVLDHLATVSLSHRRGRSLALISDPHGQPREFIGEPRSRQTGNRGVAWVERAAVGDPVLAAGVPHIRDPAGAAGYLFPYCPELPRGICSADAPLQPRSLDPTMTGDDFLRIPVAAVAPDWVRIQFLPQVNRLLDHAGGLTWLPIDSDTEARYLLECAGERVTELGRPVRWVHVETADPLLVWLQICGTPDEPGDLATLGPGEVMLVRGGESVPMEGLASRLTLLVLAAVVARGAAWIWPRFRSSVPDASVAMADTPSSFDVPSLAGSSTEALRGLVNALRAVPAARTSRGPATLIL